MRINRTMNRWTICLLAMVAFGMPSWTAQAAAQDRAAWMDEARFGMFIHWGLYAELARGEWVMNREKIPVAEYEKLAAKFNPVKFNAGESIYGAGPVGLQSATSAKRVPPARRRRGRAERTETETVPDWLATGRPGKLYIHLFKWPGGPFVLPGVEGSVAKTYLLADLAKKPLEFIQAGDSLTVHLPEKAPDDRDTVLCLVLK